MEKNQAPQIGYITYKDNKYVSQCAYFADMNYPSRKYMEDGNFFNVLNILYQTSRMDCAWRRGY